MKKRVVISEPKRLERFMHSFNENHSEERYAAPVQGVSDSFDFKFRHYNCVQTNGFGRKHPLWLAIRLEQKKS